MGIWCNNSYKISMFLLLISIFVSGMFTAKISKGRTIKQFINGTLTVPVMYTMIWICIFGGAGVRQERESSNLGYCCHNELSWFLPFNETKTTIHELSSMF